MKPSHSTTSAYSHTLEVQEGRQTLTMMIDDAWSMIASYWGLAPFIANNPLDGLTNRPFEQALKEYSEVFCQYPANTAFQRVNLQTIKWCQVYYDKGQAAIQMPHREKGLYQAWLALAVFDEQLHHDSVAKINCLKSLPDCSIEAIRLTLVQMNISVADWPKFLRLMLTSLHGWAAYTKGCAIQTLSPQLMYDYLALRLVTCALLCDKPEQILTSLKNTDLPSIFSEADFKSIADKERHYQVHLLAQLNTSKTRHALPPPKTQWLFCIDVRSEPVRQTIEQMGHHETFGVAGFFGVPVAFLGETKQHACPIILKPEHELEPQWRNNQDKQTHAAFKVAKNTFTHLKYMMTTPFALAEISGPWMGAAAWAKTLWPTTFNSLRHKTLKTGTEPYTDVNADAIPLDKQVQYATNLLSGIGIKQFAPLVVICGHQSHCENNAFASALQCGACGGHAGNANAQLMVSILNNPLVRNALSNQQINIPKETVFVSAVHHTTQNQLKLIDPHPSQTMRTIVSKLNRKLNPKKCKRQLETQAYDWAQMRPEWGLIQNAAMILGPRSLTRNKNLEGRVFLHSYESTQDKQGHVLESLLGGPVQIACWINMQYLLSTLDNVGLGAGSKMTGNLTGGIGMMQGNGSDLMHGLPLESISEDGKTPLHHCQRLQVIIAADLAKLKKALMKQHTIYQLAVNQWLHIVCLDQGQQLSLRPDGQWCPLGD